MVWAFPLEEPVRWENDLRSGECFLTPRLKPLSGLICRSAFKPPQDIFWLLQINQQPEARVEQPLCVLNTRTEIRFKYDVIKSAAKMHRRFLGWCNAEFRLPWSPNNLRCGAEQLQLRTAVKQVHGAGKPMSALMPPFLLFMSIVQSVYTFFSFLYAWFWSFLT